MLEEFFHPQWGGFTINEVEIKEKRRERERESVCVCVLGIGNRICPPKKDI